MNTPAVLLLLQSTLAERSWFSQLLHGQHERHIPVWILQRRQVYIQINFITIIAGFRVAVSVNYSTSVFNFTLICTHYYIGFDKPTLAAVSNTVSLKNPNEPLHGHLALTNNIAEMVYVTVIAL